MELHKPVWVILLVICLVRNSICQLEIGEPCTTDTECTSGPSGNFAKCENNICVCTDDGVVEPGESPVVCRKKAEKVTDRCEKTSQCQANLGPVSLCRVGLCLCNDVLGFPAKDQSKCYAYVNRLEADCEDSLQCQLGLPGKLSECKTSPEHPRQRVCKCMDTAVNEPGEHVCYLKRDKLEQTCEVDVQCTANIGDLSECKGKKCTCVAGAIGNVEVDPDTKCLPAGILIGDPCNENVQCVARPNSVCSDICHCIGHRVPSNQRDDCLDIKDNLGDPCTESQQCKTGIPGELSMCGPDGKCQCEDDAINEGLDPTCRRRANLVGDECEVNSQCLANLGYAYCQKPNCTCNDYAVPSQTGNKCLLKKELGDQCEPGEHSQCNHKESNAICLTVNDILSECRCNEGYVPNPYNHKEACMKLATQIGDRCEVDDTQCDGYLTGAKCDGITCECDPLTEVASEDKTKCIKKVDELHQPCDENVQCRVGFGECLPEGRPEGTPGTCTCISGYVEGVEKPNTCNPIRHKIGEECQVTNQCRDITRDKKAICNNNLCQCPSPTEEYSNRCIERIPLGGVCTDHLECIFGTNELVVCVGSPLKRCFCPDSFITDVEEGKCWRVRHVGDPCESTTECRKSIIQGPVQCSATNRTCTCDAGYSRDETGFACNTNAATTFLVNFVFIFMSVNLSFILS